VDYVAERWSGLSTVPVLEGGTLAAGSLAWRAFLCRDGDDFDVMPGGLARINETPDGVFLALRSGAASKDIWIPSTDANAPQLALPAMPDAPVKLRRGGLDLPSRLLDDIYWLGRYVERCDCTARLARAGFERSGSEAGPQGAVALAAILEALHRVGVAPSAVPAAPSSPPPDAELSPAESLLVGVLFDNDAPHNLRAILKNLHQLTLSVRSRLSRDAWHVLRRLTTSLDSIRPDETRLDVAIDILDQLLITLAAVSGTTLDNMVRGHAWVFLDLGRRVERAASTITLLQTLLPPRASRAHMEALLEVADSLLTYRARYLSSLQVAPVVDLVLTDSTNPRSVAFQVDAILDYLKRLPGTDEVVRTTAERRIIELHSKLLTADIEEVCGGDGSGLRGLLDESANMIWQFSDEVGNTWFSHVSSSRGPSAPAWLTEDFESK